MSCEEMNRSIDVGFYIALLSHLKTPEKNPESDRVVTEIPKGGSRRRKGVKKGE